jgi:hypothetical protein
MCRPSSEAPNWPPKHPLTRVEVHVPASSKEMLKEEGLVRQDQVSASLTNLKPASSPAGVMGQ